MNAEMQGGADKTVRSLGRLPGVFGKIGGAIGRVGGIAAAVWASLQMGIEIGKVLSEKVIMPLFGIKDAVAELKKENQELGRQAEEAAAKWEKSLTKWAAAWEKDIQNTDKAKRSIDALVQSYLKLQQARGRVASANEDAAILGLQRDKFNAMSEAQTPEEAAAVGMYHDVLIAEEEQKRKVAAYDRQVEEAATRHRNRRQTIESEVERHQGVGRPTCIECDAAAFVRRSDDVV